MHLKGCKITFKVETKDQKKLLQFLKKGCSCKAITYWEDYPETKVWHLEKKIIVVNLT